MSELIATLGNSLSRRGDAGTSAQDLAEVAIGATASQTSVLRMTTRTGGSVTADIARSGTAVFKAPASDSGTGDFKASTSGDAGTGDFGASMSGDAAIANFEASTSCDAAIADFEASMSGDAAIADFEASMSGDAAIGDFGASARPADGDTAVVAPSGTEGAS